jgi:cation:H+ antiporter
MAARGRTQRRRMMDLGLGAWIGLFIVAAAAVAVGGWMLAGSGDAIATRTGLGGLTVGLLLVSLATSLPEVATSTSAAAEGVPDLAVGGFLGSNMANMAILALVDLASRRRVFPLVELAQARVATGAIVLTAMAGLAIVVADGRVIGPVGYDTLAIAAVFGAVLVWIRRAPPVIRPAPSAFAGAPGIDAVRAAGGDDGAGRSDDGDATPRGRGIGRVLLVFAGGAAITLAAAPILALAADQIAIGSGISKTFVGAALLAAATSLPELASSVAAVRIGAADLAVGNLFGSNAFNMGVIVIADAAYPGGAILSVVSASQVLVAFGAIIMTALGLAAVLHRTETRAWHLEPDAILMLVVYALLLAATAGAVR